MKINIIGGSGLVGNGIFLKLKKLYETQIFDSKSFNSKYLKYNNKEIFNCDVFIHAAGVTDELVLNNYDYAVYKSNNFIKYLTKNLIESGCKNIIYISTVHVFGNLNKEISINLKPQPSSLYSLFHYNTEILFKILLSNSKINLLNLRIPTIYGLPQSIEKINRPEIIQYNFPLNLIKRKKIILKTSGNQYRLFASNIKVGNYILNWINDQKKKQFTNDSLDGFNLRIKEFAKICIEEFKKVYNTKSELVFNNNVLKNEVYNKIKIKSYYYINEEYSINKYLSDFFNLIQEKNANK